jgi:HSP20 family molecular chaperone IbpA
MFDFVFNNIVSVKMNDKELKYVMIVPGVSKENVNITISNNKLRV